MEIQQRLAEAIGRQRGTAAADSLCTECVGAFEVDEAAISIIFDGANSATLGASSPRARIYDELQFTFGEGPCLDSVAQQGPVLVPDLARLDEHRWPGYGPAMLEQDVRSVYAVPVVLAGEFVGALDLYRRRPGGLAADHLAGVLIAAELAEMPMLDLLAGNLQTLINDPDIESWTELASLTRVEISQATGMLMAQLGIGAGEALVRLRAHAYATNVSATEVARSILDRDLRLEGDR
ncbi:GAF and ANTAR domain-containing protein [Jatrophihabitans telluris]|uniref:GAF and ANTAR domain-containing protein n=1 Tax=Jatrophihabitans telluris TaxID=2038343 RepID=A0ABY4QZX3_9ACTN|nr:GAF and ANTAR domain-containing protein [Jatrophihabitans telluris]UQX89020.1 GAF and ANTAR domain-containing protein [Jatrophihabitans telluris]